MTTYELWAYDLDGTKLFALPARNIQGESLLNRADSLRWQMPLHTGEFTIGVGSLFPGKVEVRLLRNSQVVFSGPMWDLTASSESNTISCAAEGLESYFDVRRVDWDVSASMEQSAMMWDLMETSQGLTDGELSIVEGTLEAGTTRDFAIRRKEGKYIGDVLRDTSQLVDGFDYKIDPETREFNTWFPAKTDDANVVLEFGATIRHYSLQILGKFAANDILAQGPKEMVDYAIDEPQRANWGLRQTTVSWKDAPNRAALQDFSSRTRKLRQRGKTIPSISCDGADCNAFEGDLSWGQEVRVLIDDNSVNYDETMRCVGYQYTINSEDGETFVYYLNQLDEVT